MQIHSHDDWIEPDKMTREQMALWRAMSECRDYRSEHHYAVQWNLPSACLWMERFSIAFAKARLKGTL